MTLLIGASIMLGGVATQATASSVAQFIGARCLIGFGLQIEVNAAPLLVLELAYPTQVRGLAHTRPFQQLTRPPSAEN